MTTLTIDTLVARYHLPPSALAARERLDRAMAPAFEEALPVALARRGIDPEDGEICLREVRIPLRVRLSAGDGALVLGWSEAAAEAVAAALATGGDERAVRFASRRQALADFAAAIARGDLRRVWAWAQLGLCRPEAERSAAAAADDLAAALAGEPAAIVPVLAEVARHGLLAALTGRIPSGYWTELAARALAVAGGAAAIPTLDGVPAAPPEDTAETHVENASRVVRALARSALAAAARAVPAVQGEPALRAAFAALALIEADPGLLRRPLAAAVVAAAAALLAPAGAPPMPPGPATASNAAFREGPAPRREPEPSDLRPGKRGEDGPQAEPAEPPGSLTRVSGWTDWGGLLFLLSPAGELGIPEELAASALLAGRPSRWSLHRLALALAPVAEDDPAALAFAGLPSSAPPPSAGEPPAAPEETELFAKLAARVVAEVASRLGERELAAAALVGRVCRRRAEILADPGWLEVRLSLADVSTELRRARLDLDPGYLPFLGAVVRFVYV
jgi:hypothetical protein